MGRYREKRKKSRASPEKQSICRFADSDGDPNVYRNSG
tara:strand:- start:878 stop:991 length:114 start_codon:yes stop_codon:yes gene_type:complete